MDATSRPVLVADVRREVVLLVLLLASREPVRVPDTLVANLLDPAVSKLTLLEDLLLRREALPRKEALLPLPDSFVPLPTELV